MIHSTASRNRTVYYTEASVTLCGYLQHPTKSISNNTNLTNSVKGLLDALHEQKKLPWRFSIKLAYKLNLLFYYFINFVYQIIACAVERERMLVTTPYILSFH